MFLIDQISSETKLFDIFLQENLQTKLQNLTGSLIGIALLQLAAGPIFSVLIGDRSSTSKKILFVLPL